MNTQFFRQISKLSQYPSSKLRNPKLEIDRKDPEISEENYNG